MFGYRTGEAPVVQVHVKKPKPFKWLRKLFRRIKFKHARFEDGKYARGQRDIEKWHEDTPLAKADYPDHRWQILTRGSKRSRSRSRSKDCTKQSSANTTDSKPKRSRDPAEPSNASHRKRTDIFMNMDTLKHALDNDEGAPCHSVTAKGETTRAEVHYCSPFSSHCKDKVSNTTTGNEESLQAHLSGYFALNVEFSPVPSAQSSKHRGTFRQQQQHDSIETNAHALKHLKDTVRHTQHDQSFHEHDQDNDLNHLRVFEKRKFNKKPKNRKSKKRRPRRKGKYVELEAAPSCESLEEIRDRSPARRSSSKNERVRRRKGKSLLRPLQNLATGLRNLSAAPVFHPIKYRGYHKLCEEY